MKLASQIINKPIYRLTDRRQIAFVYQIIIEPQTGKLVAYQIKGDKIKKSQSLISPLDLFFSNAEGMIIENDLKISTKDDLPKGYKLLEKNGKLKGMKVFKDKDYIGKVKDFAIDSNNIVKRLHVNKLLSFKTLLEETVFYFDDIKIIKNNKIYLN